MPLTQEQAERVRLDLIGGPSRYGYAMTCLNRPFVNIILKKFTMEQKIVELSSQVEDSRARERWRDIEYVGLKAHLDALIALGGISPCSNDVTFPPRTS
ncbi:hypothetical protein H5410_046201 [Solanum commersonii]|uniref:Uncharacterized protein n=1 Tax=Solanum commersonii TaxID=4109 RepID=A0A9J5XDT2_SOLCO|nr:hypothetical protein H5410_046201 [Solanum commersonii]